MQEIVLRCDALTASALRNVAMQVSEGIPFRSVWPSIHAAVYEVNADLRLAFESIAKAAGCSLYYLGDVLRKRYKDDPAELHNLLLCSAKQLDQQS